MDKQSKQTPPGVETLKSKAATDQQTPTICSQNSSTQRETRGIKIDYSTLGDKITMSSATCHKCKVCISLNQMNVCTKANSCETPQLNLANQASSMSAHSASTNNRRSKQDRENNDNC